MLVGVCTPGIHTPTPAHILLGSQGESDVFRCKCSTDQNLVKKSNASSAKHFFLTVEANQAHMTNMHT